MAELVTKHPRILAHPENIALVLVIVLGVVALVLVIVLGVVAFGFVMLNKAMTPDQVTYGIVERPHYLPPCLD